MTPPNHADIAVVTVTFNSASVLPEFFDSLQAQSIPYRLFAVDNASSDESVAWMHANAGASTEIIPRSDNAGVAVGNNEGIRRALASGFRWIVLLNNDTAFGPTLFEDLVRSAELHSAEVVVPSLRFYDEPERVWYERARYDRWRGNIPVSLAPSPPETVVAIECACTCCALFDAAAFRRVGLMDEAIFVYFDDTDFFYRCHNSDVPMILDPSITLLHKVSSLTGGSTSLFTLQQLLRNRTYFVRKHTSGWRRILALAFTAENGLRNALRRAPRRSRVMAASAAFREGLRIPLAPSSGNLRRRASSFLRRV